MAGSFARYYDVLIVIDTDCVPSGVFMAESVPLDPQPGPWASAWAWNNPAHATDFGFSTGKAGAHLARSMMLDELRIVLD